MVFVPLHRRRAPGSGCGTAPARPIVVLAAVLTSIAASLIGAISSRKHAGTADYVALGAVIAVVAVGLGMVIARVVGRQGKV